MTYTCSRVLRQLRKLSGNSGSTMGYLGQSTEIVLIENDSVTFNYSRWKNEIESIIRELIRQGYLEQDFNEYHFHLTHKGLHPYQVVLDDLKIFLLKSVVVPIVISAATTLITLCITG